MMMTSSCCHIIPLFKNYPQFKTILYAVSARYFHMYKCVQIYSLSCNGKWISWPVIGIVKVTFLHFCKNGKTCTVLKNLFTDFQTGPGCSKSD